MQLTRDYFTSRGFETNHPDYVLCKMYKHNTEGNEWRIMVEEEYIPLTNKLAYNINAWRCAETGAIIKRASVHMAEDSNELDTVIKLCGIEEN